MRCSGTNFSSITKVLLPVPAESDHVPVVDDGDVALRHQHRARLLAVAVVDHARGQHPVGVVDAAGELVAPAPDDAAVDRPRLAGRRHAVRQLRGRVLAPDILLRLRRVGRELQDVVGEHHVHPGLRAAAARQRLADFAQHIVVVLEAAVARRLADAQQIVGEIVADGLVRAAAQRLALRGAFLQHRHQRLGAAQQFLARGSGRASGGLLHQDELAASCRTGIHGRRFGARAWFKSYISGLLSFWMRSTTRAGDA